MPLNWLSLNSDWWIGLLLLLVPKNAVQSFTLCLYWINMGTELVLNEVIPQQYNWKLNQICHFKASLKVVKTQKLNVHILLLFFFSCVVSPLPLWNPSVSLIICPLNILNYIKSFSCFISFIYWFGRSYKTCCFLPFYVDGLF